MKRVNLVGLCVALMGGFSAPVTVRADGGYAPPTYMMADAGTGDAYVAPIETPVQRCVFRLKEGTWEMHLQSGFSGPGDSFAWIVPLPVVPEVAESNQQFLEQLDFLTAPAFVDVYVQICKSYSDWYYWEFSDSEPDGDGSDALEDAASSSASPGGSEQS